MLRRTRSAKTNRTTGENRTTRTTSENRGNLSKGHGTSQELCLGKSYSTSQELCLGKSYGTSQELCLGKSYGANRTNRKTILARMCASILAFILISNCLMLAACGNTEKPSADTQGNEQANASTSTDTANTTDAANTGNSSSSTKITDLAGRSVSLQQPLKAALALAGPSYEKVFLLGQADKLIGGHAFIIDRPWVKETNPDISKLTPISNPAEPNIEALSALNPDAIFFWDYKEPLASMEAAKLPVVVVQQSSGNPKTATEFIAYQKREVDVFANAFGSEALSKAKTWSSYFDEKVKYVSERVSSINDDQRKRVIFAYDESGLGVFSTYSYPSFWIELAGGKNIADETGAEMDTEITMEQMAAWNPDIVFMSRADSTEQVTASEAWAEISAVKNAQVFLCPDGVMYWDYSSEGVLLMQYLAQKMYPELFTDLDMVAELKDYYQRFYGYTLSDANAQRILDHLPPA